MSIALKDYLNKFKSICWYPSAGRDFREMMYLSEAYAGVSGWEEESFPECFVLSDIMGFEYGSMLSDILSGSAVLFDDHGSTRIEASNGRELERLRIPFEKRIVGACDENYGRAVCADVRITSSVLGELNTRMVYVVMENTSFAIDFLLQNKVRIDYIVQVRYGMGLSTGMYVKLLLRDFGTRYFISDRSYPANEDYAYDEYAGILKGRIEPALTDTGRKVLSHQWSNSGDVHWYRVE